MKKLNVGLPEISSGMYCEKPIFGSLQCWVCVVNLELGGKYDKANLYCTYDLFDYRNPNPSAFSIADNKSLFILSIEEYSGSKK
jgi:hypothetical protein